ncbi:MAG: glutaminyl-peptide cyclotransferase, partial [Flavobacteriaceae bacterium]|nr:glutaminyl-peptide cyclotransferase [Flavobacteriaceae bacterium]
MRIHKYLLVSFCTVILITSCNKGYKFKLTGSKKLSLNEKTTFTLTEANNKPIDSIHFFVNGQRIASIQNSISINSANFGVGKHAVAALVFYPEKTKKINKSMEVLSNTEPAIYGYKIINTYPHDKGAYTQGLEYHNG